MRFKFALPLPHFVLHPLTALTIAAVHVYLAYGHLSKLVAGDVEWVHIWKGFGALFAAYVFAALASRRPEKSLHGTNEKENDVEDSDRVSVSSRLSVPANSSHE